MSKYNWFVVPDDQLQNSMSTVFNDYLLMQGYTLNLTEQARLNLTLVPTLHYTQVSVISLATLYQASYKSSQINLYSILQGITNTLKGYQKTFDQQAFKQLEANNSKTLASKAIALLAGDVNHAMTSLNGSICQLQSFSKQFKLVKAHYEDDKLQVAEKITGGNGEIQQLQATADSLSTQLNDVNSRIAQGATTQLLKAGELGLQAGAAVVDMPEIGTLIMDTTFDYINEAVSKDDNPLELSHKLLQAYSQTLLKMANDKAQAAVLASLVSNSNSFLQQLNDSISTLKQASLLLSDLHHNIGDFPVESEKLEHQLTDAMEFWEAISLNCNKYLNAITTPYQIKPATPYS